MDSSNRGGANPVAEAIRLLKEGGVVVLPTDTIYGFSTRLSSEAGYQRILKMKECGEDRNFLLIAGSLAMVERYIESWGCTSRAYMEEVWPASLTGIFRAGSRCPGWIGRTIAFRVPPLQELIRIIEEVGEPVFSTSVNQRGAAALTDVNEIRTVFGDAVDLIVEGDMPSGRLPSTIVDYSQERPVLIRQGSYVWAGGGNPSKWRSL